MKTWATTQHFFILGTDQSGVQFLCMSSMQNGDTTGEKLSLKGRKSNWATTHTHARLKTKGKLGLQLKTSFLFKSGTDPSGAQFLCMLSKTGYKPRKT